MHFTDIGAYHEHHPIPLIVRGDGCYVWDDKGKRFLDGLSALFCVNAGHGRQELAEASSRQARELAFYTVGTYAHPRAIELAERIAALTPGCEPRFLHPRRLGVGRERAQAGAQLPPTQRRGPAH